MFVEPAKASVVPSVVAEGPRVVAYYDLAEYPTTFDIATWCVVVGTMGANHVRFVYDGKMASWKYPEEVAWRRFANICIPMCSLAGMSWEISRTRNGFTAPYHIGDVNRLFKEKGHVHKLRAVTDSGKRGYVTITMRDSIRNKWRDSNRRAWDKFGAELKMQGREVVVIDDAEFSPIDLRKRMELYQYADMNLAASGGPITLCYLSDAPYISINMLPADARSESMERFLAQGGFPKGSQMLYAHAKQRIVWELDTYENIKKAWQEVMGG